MKFRKRLSLIIASAVLVVSSAVGAGAYAAMLRRSQRQQLFNGGMQLGVHKLSAVTETACLGTLQLELKEEDEKLAFTGQGVLRAAYQKQPYEIKLESAAQFNSLGQLGAFFLIVTVDTSRLVFGLEKINPIKASIKLEQGGVEKFRRAAWIPGPLLIKETARDSYALVYPHLGIDRSQALTAPLGLLSSYNIRLLPPAAAAEACVGRASSLDVTLPVDLLQRFAAGQNFDPQELLQQLGRR